MTNTLQIHIPQDDADLEAAVLQFLRDEFNQTVSFQPQPANTGPHKDGSLMDILWQVVQVVGIIEGALQFTERAQRLERVRKLHAAIQQAGNPVYLCIKNKTVNLYQKSADQIMNLLAGDKDDNQ
ncbi:hypothetical protein OE987_003322 [Vibrio cholerae]|nr:hypothetical protein [Vibrio cholerae]